MSLGYGRHRALKCSPRLFIVAGRTRERAIRPPFSAGFPPGFGLGAPRCSSVLACPLQPEARAHRGHRVILVSTAK